MLHQHISKIKFSLLALAFLLMAEVSGQAIKALPGNGKSTPSAAPQGAVRTQRQFYLIDSAEVANAGLNSATVLKSIGFTIGAAASRAVQGKFSVYLQNTTDRVSRIDTGWTTLTVTGNQLKLTALTTGNYEWQVGANCATPSLFSPSAFFDINSDTCKLPTRFITDGITGTAADLRWTKPSNSVDSFKVEYTRIDSVSWTTAYTTAAFYHVTGLIPGQSYRWKVSSSCSDADQKESAIFTTNASSTCPSPTGLAVGTVIDTSAKVSWTGVSGAIQYEIRYRRQGSNTWDYQSAGLDSATLFRLSPGTKYEWQVRAMCSATDYGNFVDGSIITTTGTLQCYPPENRYTDSLSASSAKLSWDAVANATNYKVRYRQLETVSWTNAIAGMTQVHRDSILIPDTTGAYFVSFPDSTAFTYTGKGLYVAYEYVNDSTAPTSPNVALASFADRRYTDANGEDSARIIMSLGVTSQDSLPSRLSALPYRPETWFGSASLKDSAAVVAVYGMGYNAIPYGNPTTASALIRNYSNSSKTYTVKLTVKDNLNAVRHTQDSTVTVQKDSVLLVRFRDWSATGTGTDSIIVSVPTQPGENVINNNRGFYLQRVNNTLMAHADEADAIAFTGADAAGGLSLARYKMNGCGAVNAVQVYLGPAAIGRSVHAVIMNSSGTIIDSSASLVPSSAHVNGYQSFYFSSAVTIASGSTYYVGLAQKTGFPAVGVQWEDGMIRKGAFYRAKLDGSGLKDTMTLGRLMIRAEIIAGTLSPTITGNLVLCSGSSNQLTAAGISRRFAKEVLSVSSESSGGQFSAAETLGAPNVYPAYSFSSGTWIGSSAGREYLVLKFPAADSINYVDIFETYNPGAVDTVYVKNPDTGLFEVVYSGAATGGDTTAKIKRVTFPLTDFKVDEVRIALNGAATGGNNAIDAVSIGRISSASFATYAWSKKTSTGTTSLGTMQSVSASTAGDYTLTVTNVEGCTASYTATVISPDRTPPVVTASGPLTFCEGDSITLRSNKRTGNIWSTGATTQEIVVKNAGSYSLSYNDGTGCGALSSNSITVTVNSFPVVTITGNLGICPDATTTLTASASGSAGYTYLWSNGIAAANNTVGLAGSQSVTATDAIGCATTTSAITFITAKPEPNISGVLNFCPGGSTVLNAGSGFASYLWSSGGTTNTVSVNVAAKYHVRVTDTFGCIGTDTVLVGQFVPPTPSITGSLSICGGVTTLNAGAGYVGYSWNSGQTTQTIRVTTPGESTVTVTDLNGCSASVSAITVKDTLPSRPGPITGSNSSICNATGLTYSIASQPEATHYVWFAPEGASIVSGQGTTNVVLAFSSTFISGDLIVAASNACGQSASLVPRVLPLNTRPSTPGAISGPLTGVCSGPKIYSTTAVGGATSYTWSVPTGVTIKSGQGTTSITVEFSPTFTSGSICVKADNACGSSSEKCLTVTGIPNAPTSITGPASVCYKQSNVTYSTPLIEGAITYTWTVPTGATITSGQGSNSIKVKFGTASGKITVRANNTCGTTKVLSTSITVTNCANTRTNLSGDDLADLATYQQLERDVISSAGNVSKTRTLQLEWTMGEPCIETLSSAKGMYTQGFHQPLVVLSKETLVKGKLLKITAAPNPVSTKLKVSMEGEKEESVILHVRDAGGRIVFTKTVLTTDKGIEINMSGFSQGLYVLSVQSLNGDMLQNFKIVKVN